MINHNCCGEREPYKVVYCVINIFLELSISATDPVILLKVTIFIINLLFVLHLAYTVL
jgi:hypothetical protein